MNEKNEKKIINDKLFELDEKYRKLEEKRINYSQCILPAAASCLDVIDPFLEEYYSEFSFTSRCEAFLKDEFSMQKKAELAPKVLPVLKECSHLMKIIFDPILTQILFGPMHVDPERAQESTQVDPESIRCLINSLPTNEMTSIWCAHNLHEYSWSEKHFHECLPDLKYKVDTQIKDYENSIKWIKNHPGFEEKIVEFIKTFSSFTAP
jgi:hypothetical protein